MVIMLIRLQVFQSTLSEGRATKNGTQDAKAYEISIHALRGESDANNKTVLHKGFFISIHALRGESDVLLTIRTDTNNISIHALRGESDSKHIQNAAWRFG